MSYRIFIKTDSCFDVGVGTFEDFADAKTQVEKMIVELFYNLNDRDVFGKWDNFKKSLPKCISRLIENFETEGCACVDFLDEGNTDNYHYVVTDSRFEINETRDCGFVPDYSLETNMLNMPDGDTMETYYFRIWSSLGDTDEGLTIGMEQQFEGELLDLEDIEPLDLEDL